MLAYAPANHQVQSVDEVRINLKRCFEFFYPNDLGYGPVEIRGKSMSRPFMNGLNRASVKKLNAKQVADRMNVLLLIAKLDERGIKNLQQAIKAILVIISKESESVLDIATTLICDMWGSVQSQPLNDSVEEIRKLITVSNRSETAIFERLEMARKL